MSRFERLALLLCMISSAAAIAATPYRGNVPATLAPPPAPAPDTSQSDALRDFATGYTRAKRPRIAIFWNREFGDQLETQFERYERDKESNQRLESGTSDATNVEHGSTSMTEKDVNSNSQREHTSGTRALPVPGARTSAAESVAWRLESAFMFPFLEAGTQLIDRNVTMRVLALTWDRADRADAQGIEASALAGKADLLMEVLMTPDADSPIGCRFRVTVKDVKSGAILALLSTRAIPQVESSSHWASVAGGFRRVTNTRTPVLEEFAERLAAETMFQLSRRWMTGG